MITKSLINLLRSIFILEDSETCTVVIPEGKANFAYARGARSWIFRTIPVTTAGCERSFSKRIQIKNYSRSTIGQERLTSTAILEYEFARKISHGGNYPRIRQRRSKKSKFLKFDIYIVIVTKLPSWNKKLVKLKVKNNIITSIFHWRKCVFFSKFTSDR